MATTFATQIFLGRCLSTGLAQGVAVVREPRDSRLDHGGPLGGQQNIEHRQVDDENGLLDDAVARVTDDLLLLAATVERELSAPLGQVFDVHRVIANDASLRSEMRREISENLVCAAAAVRIVFGRWEERFLQMKSSMASSKSDDLADVSQRLHDALTKALHPGLADIPPDCVLLRDRLLPSDAMFLADNLPAAMILEHGSHGSHAALFARAMELPCVVGCVGLRAQIGVDAATQILVDAARGEVTLAPDAVAMKAFAAKQRVHDKRRRQALDKAQEPAVTLDGTAVTVMANVGSVHDARRALAGGADGIGLLRVEQVYLGRVQAPDVAELQAILRAIMLPFRGKPICVRLLDAGGDKQLPFLGIQPEANPALGCRGIRLLRAQPQLLDTGLRALVELSAEFPLSILVPMVTVRDDMIAVRDALVRICAELERAVPPLGAMIETPAAALMVDLLRPHVDFICFGTNDLTQYCFAVDRDSAAVDSYFQDDHEAIFRLLEMTLRAVPDLPAALCGELASHSRQLGRLIDIGLTRLSVAPPLVADLKEAVRRIGRTVPAAGGAMEGHLPVAPPEVL